MEITLPSGVVLEGVPDGLSDQEIKSQSISRGLATEDDFVVKPLVSSAQLSDDIGKTLSYSDTSPEANRAAVKQVYKLKYGVDIEDANLDALIKSRYGTNDYSNVRKEMTNEYNVPSFGEFRMPANKTASAIKGALQGGTATVFGSGFQGVRGALYQASKNLGNYIAIPMAEKMTGQKLPDVERQRVNEEMDKKTTEALEFGAMVDEEIKKNLGVTEDEEATLAYQVGGGVGQIGAMFAAGPVAFPLMFGQLYSEGYSQAKEENKSDKEAIDIAGSYSSIFALPAFVTFNFLKSPAGMRAIKGLPLGEAAKVAAQNSTRFLAKAGITAIPEGFEEVAEYVGLNLLTGKELDFKEARDTFIVSFMSSAIAGRAFDLATQKGRTKARLKMMEDGVPVQIADDILDIVETADSKEDAVKQVNEYVKTKTAEAEFADSNTMADSTVSVETGEALIDPSEQPITELAQEPEAWTGDGGTILEEHKVKEIRDHYTRDEFEKRIEDDPSKLVLLDVYDGKEGALSQYNQLIQGKDPAIQDAETLDDNKAAFPEASQSLHDKVVLALQQLAPEGSAIEWSRSSWKKADGIWKNEKTGNPVNNQLRIDALELAFKGQQTVKDGGRAVMRWFEGEIGLRPKKTQIIMESLKALKFQYQQYNKGYRTGERFGVKRTKEEIAAKQKEVSDKVDLAKRYVDEFISDKTEAYRLRYKAEKIKTESQFTRLLDDVDKTVIKLGDKRAAEELEKLRLLEKKQNEKAKKQHVETIKKQAVHTILSLVHVRDEQNRLKVKALKIKTDAALGKLVEEIEAVVLKQEHNDAVERANALFKKLDNKEESPNKWTKLRADAQEQIDNIFASITRSTFSEEKLELLRKTKEHKLANPDLLLPPKLAEKLGELEKTPFENLSTQELEDVSDEIEQIIKTSDFKQERDRRIEKTSKENKVSETQKHIIENTAIDKKTSTPKKDETGVEKVLRAASEKIQRYRAGLKKLAEIVYNLDGFQDFGPVKTLIQEGPEKARDALNKERHNVFEKRKKLWEPLGGQAWYHGRSKELIQIGDSDLYLTVMQVCGLRANFRAFENREYLKNHNLKALNMDGRELEALIIKTVNEKLTDAEKNYVDGWIKILDESYTPVAATYYKLTGKVLPKIDFYFPISFDYKGQNNPFAEDDVLFDVGGSINHNYAAFDKGFLEKRTGGGRWDLDLDFEKVAERHLDKAFTYAYMAIPLKESIGYLANEKYAGLQRAIEGKVGKDQLDAMKEALRAMVNKDDFPTSMTAKMFDRFAGKIRYGSVVVNMGLRIPTALQSTLSIPAVAQLIGWDSALSGIKQYLSDPKAMEQSVEELSDYMKYVWKDSANIELRDLVSGRNPFTRGVDAKIAKASMYMFTKINFAVSYTGWLGAYNEGLSRYHGDTQKASGFADSIVQRTQGVADPINLASIQRSGNVMKLFTQFYTGMSTVYNLMDTEASRFVEKKKAGDIKDEDWARAFAAIINLFIIPAYMNHVISNPRSATDKEKIAASMVQYAGSFDPLLGRAAVSVFSEFSYNPIPAMDMMKYAKRAVESDSPEEFVKNSAISLGYLFAVPTKQIATTAGGMLDLMQGYDDDLLRLIYSEYALKKD